MKKCPNNHDNPNKAKFCRICGYNFDNSLKGQFQNNYKRFYTSIYGLFGKLFNVAKEYRNNLNYSSTFTPDVFPNIKFSPCSVVKINFNRGKGLIFMMVLVVLFVGLRVFEHDIWSLLDAFNWPSGVSYYVYFGVLWLLFFIFLFKFVPCLKRLWKWIAYKTNADYIESSAFIHGLYRIAKKGKLGLFDINKKSVIMGCHYDNVSIFDSAHILIDKNGKKGLFSINKMGMIVPIRFDRIEQFKNSIAQCHKGNESLYYDVNGNKMK